MYTHRRALLETHFSCVLFGGTALFSKAVGLPATHITLWRSVVAMLTIAAVQLLLRQSLRLRRGTDYLAQLGLGALLGLHWITYFASMQVSTVAIGLISLFSAPVITAFLEPLLCGTRLRAVDVALGAGVFVGVCLLVPEFSWTNAYLQGVLWGVLSAVLLSLRNVLHRQARRDYTGLHLMLYQALGVAILTAAITAFEPRRVSLHDGTLLVLLGVVFTALPHTLATRALGRLSAMSVVLISSLSIVYGTLFAWAILGERPPLSTLAGGLIVAACAVLEGLRPAPVSAAAIVVDDPSAP